MSDRDVVTSLCRLDPPMRISRAAEEFDAYSAVVDLPDSRFSLVVDRFET